jgi:hypothetical protein
MEVADVVRRCLALFNGICEGEMVLDRGRVEVAYQSMRVLHYLAQQDNESQAVRPMMGQAGAFTTLARLLAAIAAAKAAKAAAARSIKDEARIADDREIVSDAVEALDEEEAAVPNERRAEPEMVRSPAPDRNEAEDEEDEEESMDEGEAETEEEGGGLRLALSKLQAEAAGTLWSLCIAYPTNKQKVPTALHFTLRVTVELGTNAMAWPACDV